MSNDFDAIIRQELMRDIQVEATDDPTKGPKAKVYPKVGGIVNLGRTYFVNKAEVFEKDKIAQQEMAQKYGAEMYGLSSQLGGQRSNFKDNGGGTGSGSNDTSSLIRCSVSTFMVIPDKGFLKESGGQGFAAYRDAWKAFDDYVQKQSEDWHKTHDKSINALLKLRTGIKENAGAKDELNQDNWKKVQNILAGSPWKEDIKSKTGAEIKKLIDDVQAGHKSWETVGSGDTSANGAFDASKAGDKIDNNEWNPNLTFKINIYTNFNADWYKRKFKSGLLNKAIMAVKTDAMSRQSNGAGGKMKDHVYTADEMLPQDERKLDSLQWKMTNKVAKDYISLLLGWSREKQKYVEGTTNEAATELTMDDGFGKKMADKALNNRGILGRMKQKLFAGQQNTNTLQICFQLADPNDGWEVVKKEHSNGEGQGEGGDSEGGGESGGTSDSGSSDSGGNGGSSGSGAGGSSGGSGDRGNAPVPKDVIKGMIDPNGEGGDGKLSLLQRVIRLEKDIFGGEQKGDDKGGVEGGVSKDGAAPSPDSPDAPQAVGKMEEEPNPEPEAQNGEPTPKPLPPLDDGAKPVDEYKIFHEPKKQKTNDEGEIAYQRKQLKSDEPVKTKAGGDLKVGQFRPYDWATPSELAELKKTYNQFLKEHPEYIPGAGKKTSKKDASTSDKTNDAKQDKSNVKDDSGKKNTKKDTKKDTKKGDASTDKKKSGDSAEKKTQSKKGDSKKKDAKLKQDQKQSEEEPQKMAAESYDDWVNADESTTLKLCSDGVELESDRYKLVKDICLNKESVNKLIDNCIQGYIYR